MAVDVMVERLAEAGLNVVRLGHPMRVSDGVASRTLDARVQAQPEFGRVVKTRQDAEQRQREADRYVRNFGPEQREARRTARAEARAMRKEAEDLEAYLSERVLREADVVCATLVGCDDRRLRGLTFDVAVVDEAAQALPPATLIPMRRAERLVLCGDPCQLPPTVKSQRGEVLKITMLERLIDKHKDQTVMLEVQHRMHASIMSAGNERFYGGKLQAHENVANRGLKASNRGFGWTRPDAVLTNNVLKREAVCPIEKRRSLCWTGPPTGWRCTRACHLALWHPIRPRWNC